jgi:hypothetical protein
MAFSYYDKWQLILETMTLRNQWYFIPEAIFGLAMLTRIIVAIVATIRREPGCDCFMSAALYTAVDHRLPRISVLCRIPRYVSLILLSSSIVGTLVGLVMYCFFEITELRKETLNGLIVLSIFFSSLQLIHFICKIMFNRFMRSMTLHRIDFGDLEDVAVDRPPVDVSPYRKIVTTQMITTASECPICSDAFRVGENITWLECEHFLHEECAAQWFRRVPSCPLCRTFVTV